VVRERVVTVDGDGNEEITAGLRADLTIRSLWQPQEVPHLGRHRVHTTTTIQLRTLEPPPAQQASKYTSSAGTARHSAMNYLDLGRRAVQCPPLNTTAIPFPQELMPSTICPPSFHPFVPICRNAKAHG
jgi:hypothetical protein